MNSVPASDVLRNLKCEEFEEARALALRIGPQNSSDGVMVPVGPWILGEHNLMRKMAMWRESSMDMFFSRFRASMSSTREYLATYSLGKPDRILFLLETNGVFVGHVGLSNVGQGSAEIDNVIKGESADSPAFISEALRCMISWARSTLEISHFQLRVLSTNSRAIKLYTSLGFYLVKSDFLMERKCPAGAIHLVPCSSHEATVSEKSNLMEYHLIN